MLHDGRELYLGVLSIDHAGSQAVATPPSDTVTDALPASSVATHSSANSSASKASEAELAVIWNPLPNVKWTDAITAVEPKLRTVGDHPTATIVFNRLHLANSKTLLQSETDIDIIYQNEQLRSIEATFSQPPILADVIAKYDKILGAAVDKQIAASEDQVTAVKWVRKTNNVEQVVVLTETQGTLGVVYSTSP